MGSYVADAQRLVPLTEAPVRELRSSTGWRIVLSAFLRRDRDHQGEAAIRIRFFDLRGENQATDDILMAVERTQIGNLFGGDDEIFAVTSEEEHSYNDQTEIWFLPRHGMPERLLWIQGVYEHFFGGSPRQVPGVTIARQTYDGVHSETKGTLQEFYRWDRVGKSLKIEGR